MMKIFFSAALLAAFLFSSCSIIPNASKRKYNPLIKYVGVGSSAYVSQPVHEPRLWKRAVDRMENSFPGSEPVIIWTVGSVNPRNTGVTLEFPSSAELPYIGFASNDIHKRYLHYFDVKAISVFLRIEPGFAPVEEVIDLVLSRYSNFSCVIGVGIDAGWYNNTRDPGNGMKVTDALAQAWEKKVKSFNTNYRLFIQQNDPERMPPTYRGDIIFVDGESGYRSVQDISSKMTEYADRFYPNLVFFQVGYAEDMHWWKRFKKPQERIGDALAEKVRQECGIVWTDRTLKETLLK